MSTLTITEFLEARIAEDEKAARAANVDPWWWEAKYVDMSDPVQSFGPRFAPARVLAECAAKRAIIEQAGEATSDRYYVIGETCVTSAERDAEEASNPGDLILKALAAVYKDHPDHDSEWAL